jgi:cyclic beta-1,2-glucan synthetase
LPSAAIPYEPVCDGTVTFDTSEALPLLCWSHTLANRAFGALMCEYGYGHVWRRNARENQLTPWRNDVLADSSDEQVTVTANGETVSLFAANDGWACRVEYGPAYCKYVKQQNNIKITTTVYVPVRYMARVTMIDITGLTSTELTVRSMLRMGNAASMERYVSASYENGIITAQNHYNTAYSPQKTVIACSQPFDGCDEQNPVTARVCLSGSGGIRAVLLFGCAQNDCGIKALLRLLDWDVAEAEWRNTVDTASAVTKTAMVASGDPKMDQYLNGWALYQTIYSRMFARTSMYQCGGAYGYRRICMYLRRLQRLRLYVRRRGSS